MTPCNAVRTTLPPGDPANRLEAHGSSIPNASRERLHQLQSLLLHLLRGLRAPRSLLGLLGADLGLPSVKERCVERLR